MATACLFWHIFVTEKTAAIVAEQLHFVERQPYMVTAVITMEAQYQYLVGHVINMIKGCKSINSIKIAAAKEFEFDTLKILYQEAANYEFVGYFHTKGAVMQSPNTLQWRNLMNFHTLQMAETAIDELKKGFDFTGTFGTKGLEGQNPYVAGNFWWAKSSYIKLLPFPAMLPNHTRYDCELWIGLGGGKMKTALEMGILEAPVTGIAEKYDTDKKIHGYIPFYEMYLAPFRNIGGTLLEIGVYRGESLKLWREALPYFIVEGADIEEKPEIPVKIYVGDQGSRRFLSMLPDFDIIIDDGGHRSRQQIISLVCKIQPALLYVIEDLHTSQPGLYQDYHEPEEITCLDYLTQYPHIKPDYISEAEHKRLQGKKIYIEQGIFSPIAFIL